MENDTNETIIDSTENNDELELDLDLTEETQEETPAKEVQQKPVETPEAKLARLKRQTAQLEKHLGIQEKPKSESPAPSKSSELGYAEKAFILANDIKVDEIPLVQQVLKQTGMELDELVQDEYFQSKLKSFRDAKATKDAVPTGTKRSSPSPKTSDEYWVNKYLNGTPLSEVPVEFRGKAIDARVVREKAPK